MGLQWYHVILAFAAMLLGYFVATRIYSKLSTLRDAREEARLKELETEVGRLRNQKGISKPH